MDLSILFSAQLLFGAIATAAIYALVAIGLNLIYGTMKLLNVAHGELVMLGGYAAFLGFTRLDLPPPLTAIIIAVGAGVFGIALYGTVFSRLLMAGRRMERTESNSLLLFFGLSVVLQNLAALLFSGTPRGYEYLSNIVRIGDLTVTASRLLTAATSLALVVGIALFFRFHPMGLSMRALIERRDAALVVGVNIERIQKLSFAISFSTAALAGALISMNEQVTPFSGFPFTVAAFIVIISGGIGNIAGGIVAALLLAFLETYGVALTSGTWRSILLYGLFVLIIVVRPQGLFGKAVR